MSPTLQRTLVVSVVAVLLVSVAGIVVLAALGKPQPPELLAIPPALIVAITSGQLFLGHQGVVNTQTTAMAGTIQTLTNQLAGMSAAAAPIPATPAPDAAATIPATSAPAAPDMTTGSTSSGDISASGADPTAPSPSSAAP